MKQCHCIQLRFPGSYGPRVREVKVLSYEDLGNVYTYQKNNVLKIGHTELTKLRFRVEENQRTPNQ